MTDTGQIPGEGQPGNAGAQPGQPHPADAAAPAPAGAPRVSLPGRPAHAPSTYAFLAGPDAVEEGAGDLDGSLDGGMDEDDLLLMPGAQGAWTENPPAGPAPTPRGSTHETGGRDTASVEYGAVRDSRPTAPPTPPRRPLHMGPPVPDTSGGVVRSLADRGPAAGPRNVPPVRHPGPPTAGPEYLDVPRDGADHGPRLGEVPPQAGAWDA
ncbi:hypothetical protein ADK38_16440, partial [Streptomyces varsoviensis]